MEALGFREAEQLAECHTSGKRKKTSLCFFKQATHKSTAEETPTFLPDLTIS